MQKKNPRGRLLRSLAAQSPVCGFSWSVPCCPPHSRKDGGFSQCNFAWDASDPRAFPWPVGAWQAIGTHTHGPRAQHPLVAASGTVASTLDHSSHPTCLPRPVPHHQPSGIASQGGGGGRQDEGQALFSGLWLSPNCLYTDHSPPPPEQIHWGDPSDNRGGRTRCGSTCYLPVPQVLDHRAGHSTTLASISSVAKQAFIAALAARLRRRAAQRIPKTEGNCSPPSRSARLNMRQKTLFPSSTVAALGEVLASPFHRVPSSAPSFSVLLRSCLQSSLKPRLGGREG